MGVMDKLDKGKFAVVCEVEPPKGVDVSGFLDTAGLLKGRADALLVTDMPGAVMKMGSIAACCILKNNGHDSICNISCRDRNVLALQADLLSASALGLKNIYITEGDDITFGDHPQAKPVKEVSSDELISIARRMQEGYDLAGNDLDSKPGFNVGAYVNCNAKLHSLNLEIMEMEKRIKEEVAFFLTPAVFDLKSFEEFIKKVEHYKVPIIAGVILLKSVATARFINKHVEGVNVPDPVIDRLYSAGDKVKESIAITAELINGLKDLCAGVNIMAMGWELKIPQFLDAVKF